MIICERCSTENPDGSRYCDECGAALWLAGRVERPTSNGGRNKNGDSKGMNRLARNPSRPIPSRAAEVVSGQKLAAAVSSTGGKPHARLVIERGRSAGKQFSLNSDDAQIGRWDADGGVFPDVDLDDDDPEAKVSRKHARIVRAADQYFIEDLGSTNGTFINRGRRLAPGDRQTLNDGDEIIVGKTFLRFHVTK
jgi:pSer/pThr/pTyr-binding forkhead associated (FHA) protein